jgi:hypothetical protein
LIGESTFSEIFVNCDPEKIILKGTIPTTTILGIPIKFRDSVDRTIELEKISQRVPSSSDVSAGNKNEILIDFRLGFSQAE